MRGVLNFLKQKTALLGAVIIAAIVGGMTATVVMAAIPDSQGVIHGCIRANNSNLRIIDTEIGETCTGAQTPISWDQEGVKAYAHVLEDGTLDVSRSKNINSMTTVFYPGEITYAYCFDISVPVKNVNITTETHDNPIGASVDSSSFGWQYISGGLCPSGTDAVAGTRYENQGFYVSFH